MERAGVPPSPPNYNLWFTHVSGSNPELSRQISSLLNKRTTMTPMALEALHSSFSGPKIDVDEIIERADAIQQAAQAAAADVADNGEHLREYGDTLSHWTAKLSQKQTLEVLSQAVATLAAETARASERNQILEQKLTASSARISRLRDNLADVRREATTDMLTGLFNRKAFDAKLRRALGDAKTEESPVSVLLIDVDHFKRVNDTYGHNAGDLVLRLIGRLLSENVKGRDVAARYGGEEFAVLLLGADLEAAATVADQIRAELESKNLMKRRASDAFETVTASVGVAQFRANETATKLIERADAALYRAKDLGRNQVCTE